MVSEAFSAAVRLRPARRFMHRPWGRRCVAPGLHARALGGVGRRRGGFPGRIRGGGALGGEGAASEPDPRPRFRAPTTARAAKKGAQRGALVTLVSAVLAFSRRPLLEAAANREPGVFFGVRRTDRFTRERFLPRSRPTCKAVPP